LSVELAAEESLEGATKASISSVSPGYTPMKKVSRMIRSVSASVPWTRRAIPR